MAPKTVRIPNFYSEYVAPRNVDIWLPPGCENQPEKRFPVLYMHDGQNLFDPALAYGGVDWGVVPALERLIADGEVREAIVVGVWNTEKRFQEYLPWKPFSETPRGQKVYEGFKNDLGAVHSDDYLQFLVCELKPYLDEHYRTLDGAQDTAIMGSSMGALISLYALCEYPQIFGGAGCVSTHWPVVRQLMINYLKMHLPDPKTHRLYFDFGTLGLDADYEPYQVKADKVMEKAGYRRDQNWMTLKYDGADHNEASWQQRVHIPLAFLLGNEAARPAA